MDFDIHVITHNGGGHVLTVHQDKKDEGPLHLISAGKLARLEEIEAMMERMMGEPLEGEGASCRRQARVPFDLHPEGSCAKPMPIG